MKHDIGQIIFVVNDSTIEPVVIIEEIVKKSLKGVEENYLIQWQSGERTLLSDVVGEKFNDAEALRIELVKRASFGIDRMISAAEKVASDIFKKMNDVQPDVDVPVEHADEPDDVPVEHPSSGDLITLPDGRLAKVRSVKVSNS